MPGSPRRESGDFPVDITGTQKARPTKRGPDRAGINSAGRYKIAREGTMFRLLPGICDIVPLRKQGKDAPDGGQAEAPQTREWRILNKLRRLRAATGGNRNWKSETRNVKPESAGRFLRPEGLSYRRDEVVASSASGGRLD